MTEAVNHPSHYNNHPSGVECQQVTRHLSFNRGNAFKYIFRHRYKMAPKQDIQKALWYIRDEIRSKNKEVSSNEYRRRALIKILQHTPETWEAKCYMGICTPGFAGLRIAEQALLEHIGAQS